MRCHKCNQERPENIDPVAERAWDLLHDSCERKWTWLEFKTASDEFNKSHNLLSAAIAAAFASRGIGYENY